MVVTTLVLLEQFLSASRLNKRGAALGGELSPRDHLARARVYGSGIGDIATDRRHGPCRGPLSADRSATGR